MIDRLQRQLPFLFFALGFFTCTWDLLLTTDVAGLTLKLHQLCFLVSFLLLFFRDGRKDFAGFFRPLFQPFGICIIFMIVYLMGMAPWSYFALKTLLYSGWLVFNLLVIWLTAQHLRAQFPPERFLQVVWGTLLFTAFVILIDQAAYRYGYTAGLIGNNQDLVLKWGISRPHAFSSEPSYIAAFLCLGLITCAQALFSASKHKPLFLGGVALVMLALVSTTSRSGWGGLGLGLGGLVALPVLLRQKDLWRVPALFLAILVAVIGLYYFSTPQTQRTAMGKELVNPVIQGNDGSGTTRVKAHIHAFNMARDTSWHGTGLGASYTYYVQNIQPDYNFYFGAVIPSRFGNEVIMSTWGQLLAEGGLPAILIFAAAAFFLLRSVYLSWKKSRQTYALNAFVAASVFFIVLAFWLGNIARGDVWVWYALWSAMASAKTS